MTSLTEAVDREIPRALDDLVRLVAIESISADPDRADQVRASAEEVVRLLTEASCPDARVVSAGGRPAVIGHFPAPQGKPTVCLYAHHDVQPTGAEELWTSAPFAATRRGERLYGRGVADDKGGVALHLATLRAFDGQPPVGVTVFVEGEEEIGSPSLAQTLTTYADDLVADVFVIADSGNWDVGVPSFTTTLRGLADCVVEVRTLDHALHSGSFGGVAPDALTTLCRLVATLHDDQGNVAVDGLVVGEPAAVEYPPDRLRAETGILDGVGYLGGGSVVHRLWTKPAIAVIALDATPLSRASNTLIPSAKAKISLRLAPGDHAGRALGKLVEHLHAHAPFGAQVIVTEGDTGDPSSLGFAGPYAGAAQEAFAAAYGTEPVLVGQGGSIPMVAELAERFPDATILVTAVADPGTRAHGIDESLHLGDFARACHAQAGLLERLGQG